MADEHQDESAAKVARDAALAQLVSLGVYLAVMLGLTVAIAKRDMVTRLGMRARACWRHDEPASVTKAIAELRRDISAIEHGGGPDTTRRPGLYERGAL